MRLLCCIDACNVNVPVVNADVQLPSATMSSEDGDKHEDNRNDKCTICLSIFEDDERVRCVLCDTFMLLCSCF